MPPGPSIDWFPLWLSLRVAAISTALALVIGLWLAWTLANRTFCWGWVKQHWSDILGPALMGFATTPEFLEIAQAQTLLSELSAAAQL